MDLQTALIVSGNFCPAEEMDKGYIQAHHRDERSTVV